MLPLLYNVVVLYNSVEFCYNVVCYIFLNCFSFYASDSPPATARARPRPSPSKWGGGSGESEAPPRWPCPLTGSPGSPPGPCRWRSTLTLPAHTDASATPLARARPCPMAKQSPPLVKHLQVQVQDLTQNLNTAQMTIVAVCTALAQRKPDSRESPTVLRQLSGLWR